MEGAYTSPYPQTPPLGLFRGNGGTKAVDRAFRELDHPEAEEHEAYHIVRGNGQGSPARMEERETGVCSVFVYLLH